MLLLDPGLAFGAGTHPSTALCLEWLADHRLDDLTIIDYGCGSGNLFRSGASRGLRFRLLTRRLRSMYTHCPDCNTAFRITTAQLRMGQGQVMCSKCGSLFDAISFLSDIAFEDSDSEFRNLPILPMEQALAPPGETDSNAEKPVATASWLVRSGWLSGITIMVIGLVVQLTVFEGEQLVQNPDLRSWFEELCALFQCELPSYRDPAAIDVLEQSLEPSEENVLEFRIAMVNASRFQQAFPRIKLDLIRLNGAPLAQRIFFPEEYFPQPPAIPSRMAVGKAFEIRLEIVNPHDQVGGYHFSLI